MSESVLTIAEPDERIPTLKRARDLLVPFFDFNQKGEYRRTEIGDESDDDSLVTGLGVLFRDGTEPDKLYAETYKTEKASRIKWLVDYGAIYFKENHGFFGVGEAVITLIDIKKLEAAMASYPYNNNQFPKPNVVQTCGLEHENLVEPTHGAART